MTANTTANSLAITLILFAFSIFCNGQSAFEFVCPPCADGERFDKSSLSCVPCTANKVVDSSGFSCICAPGFISIPSSIPDGNGDMFTCSSCLVDSKVASLNREICMGCDAATSTLSGTDCECNSPTTSRLVETDAAGNLLTDKTCLTCPTNTYVFDTNPYECVSCPFANMTWITTGTPHCECSPGFTSFGAQYPCVALTVDQATWNTAMRGQGESITYRDIATTDGGAVSSRTITSAVLGSVFIGSAFGCKYLHNSTSCQCLGNQCTLQKYSLDIENCAEFVDMVNTGGLINSHQFTNWKQFMPFLYYSDDSVLSSNELQMTVSFFTGQSAQSHLTYKLARYSFEGQYLGMDTLTGQLQLCGGDTDRITRFLRFGTTYENTCYLDLSDLLAQDSPEFYDLYVVDTNDAIYPVPVKLLNYRLNGELVNVDSNRNEIRTQGSLKLNRRFFLVDNISGKETIGQATQVLVYASKMVLEVSMQSSSSSKIYPPVLSIYYSERAVSSIVAGDITKVSFAAHYRKNLSSFWTTCIVLFAITLVVGGILWLVRVFAWLRRNMIETMDCVFLLQLVFQLMVVTSELFFWLLVILTMYCFIFYKGQGTVYFIVPIEGEKELKAFEGILVYCFIAKSVQMLYTLYKQVSIDLFFVDWEKPRQIQIEIPDDSNVAQMPVSVWRKLFVANEWNEIQTHRLISVEFSLFFLLFFLRGIGLENLATSQPDMANLDPDAAPVSRPLRFIISTFFLLLIGLAQIGFRRLIYHRFFEHQAVNLVDLMAMSNLSCLILDEKYHGYYIHGKTVHQYADASMDEMNAQLVAEEKGLVEPRGLIEDKETFEVFFNSEFRSHYNNIYASTLNYQSAPRRATAPVNPRVRGDASRGNTPNPVKGGVSPVILKAISMLNKFLISFFESNTREYQWRLTSQTFLESFFNIPPLMKGQQVTYLLDDPNYHFTRVLLMGIEYQWTVFMSLLYAFVDFYSRNTFVSFFVVYLVSFLVKTGRAHWGELNIARKTLVHEKFLF